MTHLLPDKLLCHSTFTIGRNYLEKAEATYTQVFYSPNQAIKATNLTCYHSFYLEKLWSLEHQKILSLIDSNELEKRVYIDSTGLIFDVQVIGKVLETEE